MRDYYQSMRKWSKSMGLADPVDEDMQRTPPMLGFRIWILKDWRDGG
jgi:hypothetical protein